LKLLQQGSLSIDLPRTFCSAGITTNVDHSPTSPLLQLLLLLLLLLRLLTAQL
jgi:hypothetical protein